MYACMHVCMYVCMYVSNVVNVCWGLFLLGVDDGLVGFLAEVTLAARRMVSLEALGVTGPRTPLLLCERSRMSSVCKRQLGFGTRPDLRRMVAPRTLPDVGRQS